MDNTGEPNDPLQRDTFRRRKLDRLETTDTVTDGIRGRPAELFRRAPA